MSGTGNQSSKKTIFNGSLLSFDGKMVKYGERPSSFKEALDKTSGSKSFKSLGSALNYIKGLSDK